MEKNKKHHVCYIEIPADDLKRCREFYGELFGWSFFRDEKEVEEQKSPYFMIAPADAQSSEDQPHHYLGGLLKREYPGHATTVFIDVDSVEEALGKVEKLGGRIKKAKTAVPGWGFFAVCEDTEKNPFALWEENKHAGT